MKRSTFTSLFSVLFLLSMFVFAPALRAQDSSATAKKHGLHFVDKNGDGYNDLAPDDDGDGIPNGQDPDYQGAKMRQGKGKGGFVDVDGDGINDNALDADGDGIPNGQDPDYEPAGDGQGNMHRHGKGRAARIKNTVRERIQTSSGETIRQSNQ